jgi:hypothetical protein
MICFHHGMDERCRDADKPTVALFQVADGDYAYCVIGTTYGYIHTGAGGDVMTWKSRSGASRAAKSYQHFNGKRLATVIKQFSM